MCVACEKLRVAVGTSRRGVLSKTHFGDSRYFEIYEVTRKGWRLLEVRENRAADLEEAGHGDPRKFAAVVGQLGDVDVAVAWVMGPNYLRVRDASGLVPYIVRGPGRKSLRVEDALGEVVERFGELCARVEEKKRLNMK